MKRNVKLRTMTLPVRRWLAAVSLAVAGASAHADCWSDAESRYAVSRFLLLAIAQNESGLNPSSVHRNADGTVDIGLMQINSAWLPVLGRYGIGPGQLRDPCTNLQVGAWILANDFAVYGRNWRAVGAYNAKNERLRIRYARRVAQRFRSIAHEYGISR